jgi:hypothetical protein
MPSPLVDIHPWGTQEHKEPYDPQLTKEKGKAPMASSSHSFHDKNAKNAHHDTCSDRTILPMRHDAAFTPRTMIASSNGSYAHSRSRSRSHASHVVSHAPKDRNASHGPSMLYRTFDASYVLYCKNDKIVAIKVGPKCKKGKICIWVSKSYVTNLIGPDTSWGPKPQPKFLASGGSSGIIDNGCTNHMIGEKKMFTSYVKNKDSHDTVIFRDGNQGKVKGIGKIAITTKHSISNVFW